MDGPPSAEILLTAVFCQRRCSLEQLCSATYNLLWPSRLYFKASAHHVQHIHVLQEGCGNQSNNVGLQSLIRA